MKKTTAVSIIALIGIISLIFVGCSKKKSELPSVEMQTQTAGTPTQLNTESLAAQAASKVEGVAQPVAVMPKEIEQKTAGAIEVAGQVGIPQKPTAEQIQTALQNAGYYKGTVDGKLGPKSKKAIENFQKENGLVVDGKVGAKTWSKLQAYFNASTSTKTGD
jgi:peptidoglycan hydrolase-like protein with peptidoglycan-binding domain